MSMRNLVMAVLAVAVGAMVVPVQAADIYYWNGNTDSSWHTAANWGGTVPTGLEDYAYIADVDPCIISNGNDGSAGQVQIARGSTSTLTVTGAGSTLTVSKNHLYVGTTTNGDGTLSVLDGGAVSVAAAIYLGVVSGSGGLIEVDGDGSQLNVGSAVTVGYNASADPCTVEITGGGLVSVAGTLTITNANDFVNMDTNGMLALNGSASNLTEFLGLVSGTDAIRYWDYDAATPGWAAIIGATAGTDYTITAGAGDLSGYTVLTVVPEPATIGLLGIGGLLALVRKNRR